MNYKEIKFKIRKLVIKTFSWEYWPVWLVYFPVSFYYIYLSIKARSFFFFSASNPTIETGGMFFESKWKIFELIPKAYFPSTIYIETHDLLDTISNKMDDAGISFPIIAKPDKGERGWGVKKIGSFEELAVYKNNTNIEFLIQSYINTPFEFSIFYYRNPKSLQGNITSVTLKKLLSVTGDGLSTIEMLIKKNNRSFLQYKKLQTNKLINFNQVLECGEDQVLVPYGNHILGATFLDYNHIIDDRLIATFDKISSGIGGFYYGRFDIRCTSIEDLKAGKNISILELNGAGAEPAHIYDPNFSFFSAQLVLAKHYKMMYEAAVENKKNGTEYMTYNAFKRTRKLERKFKQKVILQ